MFQALHGFIHHTSREVAHILDTEAGANPEGTCVGGLSGAAVGFLVAGPVGILVGGLLGAAGGAKTQSSIKKNNSDNQNEA